MERNFETVLAEQCAPTLAGLKPASLFHWSGGTPEGAWELERRWGREFAPYGLGLRAMKTCPVTGDGLFFLYRGRWLRAILGEERNRAFLERLGYDASRGCGGLLRQLSGRLCVEGPFPHEIGLFLGYPLEDVVGFIENRGGAYTCCGCWKVYGDPEAARRRFEQYHRCTRRCQDEVRRGVPITQLIATA